MNFLLVNDDGFNQEGILILERVLSKFGEVYVVAPKEGQSGQGCSIIYNRPYEVIKVDSHHYILDGKPTNCTIFGLFNLGVNIDIVFSGCNRGCNLSFDTMYSGTIGGCYQALFSDIPSIAVSSNINFDHIEEHLEEVIRLVLDNKLYSSKYITNINFPRHGVYKGIRLAKMEVKPLKYYYVETSENHYQDDRDSIFDKPSRGTDIYYYLHGYTSISFIRNNNFDGKAYKEIKKKINL